MSVKPAARALRRMDGVIDLHRSVPVVLDGLDLDLSSSHSRRGNLYEQRVVGSGARRYLLGWTRECCRRSKFASCQVGVLKGRRGRSQR